MMHQAEALRAQVESPDFPEEERERFRERLAGVFAEMEDIRRERDALEKEEKGAAE